MKGMFGLLAALVMVMGATSAFADAACEKCTHDLEAKYRACRQSGKDQDTCSKEGQAPANACVVTCQGKKAAEGKS
jgi:hypothetical protein